MTTKLQTSLIGRTVTCSAPWLTLPEEATDLQRELVRNTIAKGGPSAPEWHGKTGTIVSVYQSGDGPCYTIEIDGVLEDLYSQSFRVS